MQSVIAAVLVAAVLAVVAAAARVDDDRYRLPGDVIPMHYAVHVAPRLQGGSNRHEYFDGTVDIKAFVVRATSTVVMHVASNIESISLANVSIKRGNGAITRPIGTPVDPTYEFLTIQLEASESLQPREVINIRINYAAKFQERMEGFYKSFYKYTDSAGEEIERLLFATHFEPTYARKAFPVFDEPKYKAHFQLSIDVPPGFSALSNTPVLEHASRNVNERTTDTIVFQETPIISVHLLAFLVFEELTYVNSTTNDSTVPITIWAPKDDISAGQADFSLSETPNILRVMENYTGIPFAFDNMQKIDQVAIPDFTSIAMENWGLIPFRLDTLLVDAGQGTEHDRQLVSAVIAHELAHQWFGNLVTPEWWNCTWLSEGFAQYFQYWVLEQLHRDWRMDERMLLESQQSIFEFDALESALPLTTQVSSPNEIVERFGEISYKKGSAVLRMINNIIGEKNFQVVLQSYLKDNQFDSVTPEKYFAAIEAYTPSDVTPDTINLTRVLKSWTEQPGFPVLSVQAWFSNALFIKQERFHLSKRTGERYEYFVQYQIHLQSGSSTPRLWLGPGLPAYVVDVATTEEWVLVNSTGYFRVNYWRQNWERLGQALRQRPAAVAPRERAQLVDDALNLARADYLSYSTALDFVRYLAHETDYLPWTAASPGFDFLRRMLTNVDQNGDFSAFVLELLDGVYRHLRFADEGSPLERLLRERILEQACAAGHTDCLHDARQRLVAFLRQGRNVEPDLRSVVYCYGVKSQGRSVWDQLLGRLQKTDNAAERTLIIKALGCTNDGDTLETYLEYSLDSNIVRRQDAAAVFSAVYANPRGVDPALDFLLRTDFDIIKQAYGGMLDIDEIVRGLSAHLTTRDHEQKLKDFVTKTGMGTDWESGNIALETAAANVEWLQHRHIEVLAALRPST